MNVVANILWMIKLHPVIRYLSLTDRVQFDFTVTCANPRPVWSFCNLW